MHKLTLCALLLIALHTAYASTASLPSTSATWANNVGRAGYHHGGYRKSYHPKPHYGYGYKKPHYPSYHSSCPLYSSFGPSKAW